MIGNIPLIGFCDTFIIILPLQLVDESSGRLELSISRESN